jgi:hypothetical protein
MPLIDTSEQTPTPHCQSLQKLEWGHTVIAPCGAWLSCPTPRLTSAASFTGVSVMQVGHRDRVNWSEVDAIQQRVTLYTDSPRRATVAELQCSAATPSLKTIESCLSTRQHQMQRVNLISTAFFLQNQIISFHRHRQKGVSPWLGLLKLGTVISTQD